MKGWDGDKPADSPTDMPRPRPRVGESALLEASVRSMLTALCGVSGVPGAKMGEARLAPRGGCSPDPGIAQPAGAGPEGAGCLVAPQNTPPENGPAMPSSAAAEEEEEVEEEEEDEAAGGGKA